MCQKTLSQLDCTLTPLNIKIEMTLGYELTLCRFNREYEKEEPDTDTLMKLLLQL
jgi:hypothetical protein